MEQRIEAIYLRLKKHHINFLESYPDITSGNINKIINQIKTRRKKE